MTTEVRIIEKALRDALGTMPGMQKAMDDVAEVVTVQIGVLAPRGPSPGGGYFQGATLKWRRVSRFARRVYTIDIAGHLIEWGSVNNPAYAPFRRAVRSLGLRLQESPKP